MNISDKAFLTIISFLVVIAIASTAYIFLVRQDFDVIIETPCDPAQNICFSRDCSGGECPPNELDVYRIFSVHAEDFSVCAESTCIEECTLGAIPCAEIVCGESEEDECVGPSNPNTQ